MSRAAHVAHFTIEGAFITETARDLVLSESSSAAWRFLKKSLLGDGVDGAIVEILEGRSKLSGDSTVGLRLEPETDAARKGYERQLRSIYAGRVRINGAWYRPRAKVADFGPHDLPSDMDMDEMLRYGDDARHILAEFHARRVAFYARNGERVVTLSKKDSYKLEYQKVLLIFEPTSEPPFWRDELKTPEDALEDFLQSGRRLGEECWRRTREDLAHVDQDEDEDEDDTEEAPRLRETREDVLLAIDAYRSIDHLKYLKETREQILKQAGGDLFDLVVEGKTLRVPRAPFLKWALSRTSLEHLAPPWKAVSRSGMKLPLDVPNHTDWMIGAGLDPHEVNAYTGPLHDASLDAASFFQEGLGGFECMVLVGGETVLGVAGKDIAVLPDLHPDRLEQVVTARAVITQAGGQLAHLAQVATERCIPIFRDPEALRRYPPGTRLRLEPEKGLIKIR